MSDRIPASQTDEPSRSPRLLARSPTRGRGVRRLNKVPVLIFVGGVCLVITAIGYTYHARLQSSVAAVREADVRAEGASGAAVLNGAPQTGEIASAAGRKPVTEPADARATTLTTTTQSAPADAGKTPQEPAADDPATQARKQAWQTYYQQLAALEQVRLQAGMDALKADTSPGGMTANGGAAPQASGAAGTGNLDPQMASAQAGSFQAAGVGAGVGNASSSGGFGYAPGGLSVGGGYPIMAAAGPDATGAREKQTFTRQTGNLGQNDTLASTVRDPISPYLVTAGDVIPCVSQSGEDSDTPGQFVGRVSRNVYDSATGRFLLIPQNSKVIGTYDNVVTNGQIRIPTVVTRIIFPDSSSIPIGAMPAADQAGFAGLHDQVETHLWEKFGNALILAIGGAGIQLSQGTGQNTNGYNAQQIGAAAIGQQFGELGEEYARSGLSIPNTLRIRNGYNFVVQVTKDMVLRPYVDRRDAGVQPVSLGPVMQ